MKTFLVRVFLVVRFSPFIILNEMIFNIYLFMKYFKIYTLSGLQIFSWQVSESLMCPDTNKLEAGFHSDTSQDRCPRGGTSFPKWLLPESMSCGWAPVASCLSGRLTYISRWLWPRLLSYYCAAPWDFVCNLCEWGVSIPQTSDSLKSKPCLPSKPNVMGSGHSSTGPPGWGALCGT